MSAIIAYEANRCFICLANRPKHVFKLTLICAQVLKEEIRKFQRSEERKKHIENSEYVKNIILKVRSSVSMS